MNGDRRAVIVVDANVAVAVLNTGDRFHRSALRRCLQAHDVAILNLTRAEALIHPTRAGKLDAAAEILEDLGFASHLVDDETADRARALRARWGNRHFPMVDAIVVGFGQVHDVPVVTCDAKWPAMTGVAIEVLEPA